MINQPKSEEDKLALILKAQGLHKFAKMSVNIGKPNMEKIVALTRYVESLARPRPHNHLGIKEPIFFLDKKALEKIKYDPIVGFIWYFKEKGEMEVFGNMLLKGEASDAAIGTASEVAAVVPRGKGEMPEVILKKELNMDDRPTQELLKEYRRVEGETEDEINIEDTPPLIGMERETLEVVGPDEKPKVKGKVKLRAPWKTG